jgi:hypothetical protein
MMPGGGDRNFELNLMIVLGPTSGSGDSQVMADRYSTESPQRLHIGGKPHTASPLHSNSTLVGRRKAFIRPMRLEDERFLDLERANGFLRIGKMPSIQFFESTTGAYSKTMWFWNIDAGLLDL